MDLFRRATDASQYDLPDVTWAEVEYGLNNAGTRLFHFAYLQAHQSLWRGASALDIGCGTGWLVDELRKDGARSHGFDPSEKNIAMGHFLFPQASLERSDLQSFRATRLFDVAIGVMSFNHFADIDAAFLRCASIVRPGGHLLLVVPDFDYFLTPRYGYEMYVERRNADESVVMVSRKEGTIADVVRKPERYIAAARRSGFRLVERTPMLPLNLLHFDAKRFRLFRGHPIAHLLRFTQEKGA